MGEIILVRHGQANSAAKTEADYDRLSDLGKTQAQWLGQWMKEAGWRFDHVLSGTMRRHRETVEGLGVTADEDPRLNEIDYFRLTTDLYERFGHPPPTGEAGFADHMPKVLAAWQKAEIDGTETYQNYETRVAELLNEAARPGARVLAVTSGGVIGMTLRHVLGLDLEQLARVMLPIWNTSVHRLNVRPYGTIMAGYNAIPHLESPDREHARTYF